MATLLSKVNEVLKKQFPDASVEIERSTNSKKVGGFLIWSGFEGKDHIKRQEMLWDALTASLNRTEQLKLAAIFTMTPDEAFVKD